MKTYFVIMACGLMVLLAGCQENEAIKNESEELRMSIEASIGNDLSSRYTSSDDTPNNLSFEAGDAIGVFVNNSSVAGWTKGTDGDWESSTSVYWNDKTSSHKFYAFYPYTDETEGVSLNSVLMPDLSTQEGSLEYLDKYDFLTAYKEQTYSEDGVVSFTGDNAFQHVSSLVAMTIKGTGDLSESTIKSISFAGTNIVSSTSYSFSEQKIVYGENDTESKMMASGLEHSMKGADYTFYFILNANTDLSGVTLSIEYSTSEGTYEAAKTGLGNVVLTSGKLYKFGLNITDAVLTISGGAIKDWEDGDALDDIVINGQQQEEETES